MARMVGTVARGIRAPIIREGDNLVAIVVDSVLKCAKEENFYIKDRDVIGITESLVARAQGNYATIHDIAYDVKRKFKGDTIAVVFPILSRNRFSMILKGIALTGKKIYLFLNYPSDEVGNSLVDIEKMYEFGINPYSDTLSEKKYRELFGDKVIHPFTGVDYVQEYKELVGDDKVEIYLTNDPREALKFTNEILVANIHERKRTKRMLLKAGAVNVRSLDEIMNEPINGSGFNPEYGLLGSNKATEDKVKLFPRDCFKFVKEVQKLINEKTGKNVEVMVYGDGAFKDPVGGIWELADPVVSPGFTEGLIGKPHEIKFKYVADNELCNMDKCDAEEAMKKKIREKESCRIDDAESLGTTPRNITYLIGSLCDLMSGSGDKGTPIVLVQGYFDNYATD